MKNIKTFHSFILNESSNHSISEDWNFHEIPDGMNNYRSAQMPIDIFPKVCKDNGIKTIIRLNWNGDDGKDKEDQDTVSIEDESSVCQDNGISFVKLSSNDDSDQETINKFLKDGNCLIHCAHGADRTGGAVGAYLLAEKPNKKLDTVEKIWKYSNKYNDWDKILKDDPDKFKARHYLGQAKKFGVKDLEHAIRLANLK